MTRDGHTAYLTLVRDDKSVDIFHAERAANGTFGTPVKEGPAINTVAQEIVWFVSRDGCRLYFNRRASGTTAKLLVVSKPAR